MSVSGLCRAASNMLEANMAAYLGELLQSSTLLEPNIVEEMIKGKFQDTKSVSIAVFMLSHNMNSFRAEFDGITSSWGLVVNEYLNSIFSQQIHESIKVYKHYMQHTLIDTVFMPSIDVVFGEDYWNSTDSNLIKHRGAAPLAETLPHVNEVFWFPGKVLFRFISRVEGK